MDLSEGESRILNIVAEKSNRTTSTSVIDNAIIKESALPKD